jgi:hypothetical protein
VHPLLRRRVDGGVHPVAGPTFLGAEKAHSLNRECLTDQGLQVEAADEHIAARGTGVTAAHGNVQFVPQSDQNLLAEKRDLPFVVRFPVEEPVPANPPPGHAVDCLHREGFIFPGRLPVMAEIVVPGGNKEVVNDGIHVGIVVDSRPGKQAGCAAGFPGRLGGIADSARRGEFRAMHPGWPAPFETGLIPTDNGMGIMTEELSPAPETFNGILCALVLHFLDGPGVERAVAALFRWLAPGRALYATVITPSNSYYRVTRDLYAERVRRGEPWPLHPERWRSQLPALVHLFEDDTLRRVLESAGFVVGGLRYFCYRNFPEHFRTGGREYLSVIAHKPG